MLHIIYTGVAPVVLLCVYILWSSIAPIVPMSHFHSTLIDDTQWVAHCVDSHCSFVNTGYEYVCPRHNALHRCNNRDVCVLVNNMSTTDATARRDDRECRVALSSLFRAPEVEFCGAYYVNNANNAADGYGSVHVTRCVTSQNNDMEAHVPLLKAAVPALVMLFATLETEDFKRDYQRVARNKSTWHCPHGTGHSPWTNAVIDQTKRLLEGSLPVTARIPTAAAAAVKDVASRSAVALCTLFDSPHKIILRFMCKVASKYHGLEKSELDFYVFVIMAALCTFPYLNHELCARLDVKILVVMCFDKTVTKHNQWSRFSTYVHQHANRPTFLARVARREAAHAWLPTIIRKTIDDCVMKLTITSPPRDDKQRSPPGGNEDVLDDAPTPLQPPTCKKRKSTKDGVFTEYDEPDVAKKSKPERAL